MISWSKPEEQAPRSQNLHKIRFGVATLAISRTRMVIYGKSFGIPKWSQQIRFKEEPLLKKIFFLFLIVLTFAISGCQSARNDQFAIYLLKQDIPATELSEVDIGQLVLEGEPILSSQDIVSYDKTSHSLELTQAAFTRIQQIFPMPVRVSGIPFVVCVGQERIYTGAFWTPLSSLSFDGVVIMQPLDAKETTLQISLGYPVPQVFTGNDPRADLRIIKAFEQDKKLK